MDLPVILGLAIASQALVVLVAWLVVRRPQKSPGAATDLVDSPTGSALRQISERLAAIEGEMPTIRVQMNGFAALTARMTAVEGTIPALLDQSEKFTDILDRKMKRDGERDRRGAKTAGDAASALMGMVPGDTDGAAPSAPSRKKKLRGLVGQGGRVRG